MNREPTIIRVLVYRPEEAPTVESIPNTLEAKQQLVGGLIETFPTGVPGALGICNEEGLLHQLPPNRQVKAAHTWILGTFLVVGDAGAEFCSLTDEQIERVQKLIP